MSSKANVWKSKATVQVAESTIGALGPSVSWSTLGSYWCRKISLDSKTRQEFMKNETVITDKFLFQGSLPISIGANRIVYKGTTYEPQTTARHFEGLTEVHVKEL